MRRTGVSVRFFLAALVAAWGPLWCCCGFGSLAQAMPGLVTNAVPSGADGHQCHKHKAESTHCHETAGNSSKDGKPDGPGKCQCSHQTANATIAPGGGNGMNLSPVLPIATLEFRDADFATRALDDHVHFDPRNTTGPPVLQGASARTFFCHFTL